MGFNGEPSNTRRKRHRTTDEESGNSDVERATTFKSSHFKHIIRILQCHPYDYYGILGLRRQSTETEIRAAYKRLAIFLHPDKNPFREAEDVFKRVSEAYEVLSDPNSRRFYDNEPHEKYQREGEWGGEFHAKAFGDEDTDVDMSDEEPDAYPSLPERIKKIYDEAAPDVNRYLKNPTKENLDHVLRFDEQIEAINKEEGGQGLGQFLMPRIMLETMSNDTKKLLGRLDNDPSNQKALERMREIVKNWEFNIGSHGYSSLWKLPIPSDIRKKLEKLERLGKQKLKKDKGKNTQYDSDTDMESQYERLGKRNLKKDKGKQPKYDSDTDMESQHSYQISSSHCTTEKGEKILAYRPYRRKNFYNPAGYGEEILTGCRFIIEQKGKRNPIKLVSGRELGRICVRTYLSLPDSEKNDVTKSASKWSIEDLDNFDKIIGAASKPFQNKDPDSNRIYPDGYYLVKWKDGTTLFKNRQALRGFLGKDFADAKIAEFYKWAREEPPWELNWKPRQRMIGPPETEEDRRTRFPKHTQADRPTRKKDRFANEELIDKYIQGKVTEILLGRLAERMEGLRTR